ncbi:MAG: HU family DNA-binding protein [Desulfobacterales bacterium]|jgi:integration host factor subunit beta
MQLTGEQLNKILAQKEGISQKKAKRIIDTMFQTMAESLALSERVDIRGFGTFKVKLYDGYIGRNPKTGESVEVKRKKLPCFKVGKALKERVNNGHEEVSED